MIASLVLSGRGQGAGLRDPNEQPPSTSRLPPASGFALVATLLMITVITGAAVAFFQSTRIERFVSRNYADLARAQMAAESGYALASSLLRISSTNDNYLIVQNTSRQLFAGQGTNQTLPNTFAYLPLFSFATNPTNFTTNEAVISSTNPVTNITGGITFTNTLPGGLTVTSPAVAWVLLTNSTGRTNARFAFWVEDLSGRLDLSVAGSTGTNTRRPTGTNPAELALWSLFNTNVALDSSNSVVNSLTNVRGALVTPASARLVNSSAITTNLLADLTAGLIHDTNEPEIIPYGFGYADRGLPKYNLQLYATNATNGTTNLLSILTNNLNSNGGFASRSGGMNGTRYLHALAANIQDYIDTDINPTTNTIGGGPVRGIEPLPFVTETATSVWWYDHDTNTPGQIWFDFRTVNYIELWNPSDRAITNLSLLVNFSNSMAMGTWSAGGNVNGFALNLSRQNTNPASVQISNTQAGFIVNGTNSLAGINLAPNEYRTFQVGGTTVHRFRVALGAGGALPISPVVEPPNLTATNNGRLVLNGPPNGVGGITNIVVELYTSGGVLYDRLTNHRVSATAGSSGRAYRCNFGSQSPFPFYAGAYPALRLFNPSGSQPALPGDPRIGFYLTTTNASVGYAWPPGGPGSSLGYRNYSRSSVLPATDYYTIPANWLDGGHTNSPFCPGPINEDVAGPPLGTMPGASATNDYVQKFNNTGTWSNIFELGNIFDPMAWNARTNDLHISSTTTAAGNGTTSLTNGGGTTLRIGRAEHGRFTNNGLRASQLLDLFAVSTNPAATVITNRIAGRINLNTATPNVLRALAAGVVQTNDLALTPGNTNFIIPVTAVANFIDGITNARSVRPFYSPAELTQITNGTAAYPDNAVFGNRTNAGATNWNDLAAEEWFSKIYPLATVRSRNFLIHVVGQAMTTNTNFASRPVATSRQMFQVYAEPSRGASGLTTNVNVRKLASWSL